jgi:hypothetical protein
MDTDGPRVGVAEPPIRHRLRHPKRPPQQFLHPTSTPVPGQHRRGHHPGGTRDSGAPVPSTSAVHGHVRQAQACLYMRTLGLRRSKHRTDGVLPDVMHDGNVGSEPRPTYLVRSSTWEPGSPRLRRSSTQVIVVGPAAGFRIPPCVKVYSG